LRLGISANETPKLFEAVLYFERIGFPIPIHFFLTVSVVRNEMVSTNLTTIIFARVLLLPPTHSSIRLAARAMRKYCEPTEICMSKGCETNV
jgi:hypothetical protein